jgi:hypothetical protein
MKIGFHTNSLSLRGTEIALYDYALHNQTLLCHESVIFFRKNYPINQSVFEKFSKHFKLLPYEGQKQLNQLIEQEKIDLTYFIKSGERDDAICESSPTLIHAVFPTKPEQFHGDKYAFVSEWLSKEYSNNKMIITFDITYIYNLDTIISNLSLVIINESTKSVFFKIISPNVIIKYFAIFLSIKIFGYNGLICDVDYQQ